MVRWLVMCRFRNGKETRKVSKLFALRGKFPPLPQPFAVPLKGAINARVMADLSAVSTADFVIPKWSVTACSQSDASVLVYTLRFNLLNASECWYLYSKAPLTNLCGMQRVRQRRKVSHDGDDTEKDDTNTSQVTP